MAMASWITRRACALGGMVLSGRRADREFFLLERPRDGLRRLQDYTAVLSLVFLKGRKTSRR
jgi:hypothetical protein